MKWLIVSCILGLGLNSTGYSQAVTTAGTSFWIDFTPNDNPSPTLSLFISSNVATSGNIYSAVPGVNQSFTVVPGVVTQVSIPAGVIVSGGIENKGIQITSNDPVTVYGLNYVPHSTDAFLALPDNALGLDYRVVTYTTVIAGEGSGFSVVATQNGTSLTILNQQTHLTTMINLDQGQTYFFDDPTLNDDLTGSRIQSNLPVAVFGFVKLVDIPAGCMAADYIVEEMFPYYSWGKNYLTVPLAGRDNSGDIFRVVAAADGTDVSINGTIVATLNAGEYYQADLVGSNSIVTSKATILAQYAKGQYCSGGPTGTGDPFMMLIPPREQFLTNYTVVNVSPFVSQWVNLVAPDYALGTIYQDGVLIPNSAFTQIGTTNFYGAQRSVTTGSHTFVSTFPFGVFVYGWNPTDSYGYPGGCSLSPVGTVNAVTLTPDTAYGQLNVTNVCLTANVTDNLMNPVVGVLINFYVSGCNPLTGNGYTDAAGNAQYCYTQTGALPCTDHVYAEVFGFKSDTSAVIWSYSIPCIDPTQGGTIGIDQTGCGSFTPSTISNLVLPSGQTGTLEYKWQISTTSSITGFTDIGSNSANFSPGIISQTTWFKRIARVNCMTDWSGSAESNVIEITVTNPLPVDLTISASDNIVCAGTTVTFTAHPSNEGTTPSYSWKVNSISVGTNSDTYSYIPINGDLVSCILTSSETCTTSNPATSNQILMIVNPLLPVSITLTSTPATICSGSPITFTAHPTNEGTTPSYSWKVNGIGVGTNSDTYAFIPVNGDLVSCILTSSEICTTSNPASSIQYPVSVIAMLPVSITVTASSNPFCPGSSVTFTATPNNGGTNPTYQWKVNGVNAGINSTYSYNPMTNDSIRCIINSNLNCVTGNPASSAEIYMSGTLGSVVTFIPCFDTVTTINAKPIKLKGGIPFGGVYSGPGVNSLTSFFTPSIAGVGVKAITYTYTNVNLCAVAKSIFIRNLPSSIFICGNTLTDVRDNKTYQTVQIGTQCWMSEDLAYGTQIPYTQDQRDNCIPEKYQNPSSILHPPSSFFYQWDELMQYDATPADQGFCPPGWHVPTENDWTILFANYMSIGLAGSPLKYSGYSGFNVLLSGVRDIKSTWDLYGFAGFYWSSTAYGSGKAWAHGMNENNPSVSNYPAIRVNAFSVRCIQD